MIISKKLKIILIVVLIFLLGIGIGFWWGKIKYAPDKNKSGQNENAIATSAEGKTFVGDFKVARVIDGDTIELENGER